MDQLVRQMDLECPNCRRPFSTGSSANCPTCVVPLVYRTTSDAEAGTVYCPEATTDYLSWFSHAHQLNKLWIAASLLYAAGHLAMLRGANPVWFVVFLVPPLFAFAVLCSNRTGPRGRRLAWIYLAAVVIGDLLAPFPQLLPGMNQFNQLPLAESRLLTWQLALNCVYLFLVLPPVYLSGRLRDAVHRGHVGVSVFAVLFGYSVWIVMLPAVLLCILFVFLLRPV